MIVGSLPFPFDLHPDLRSRLAGVAEVERFQWVRPLLRKHVDLHCGLFEGWCIRRLIRMRSGQNIDGAFLREQREIDLFPLHPSGDKHLDDERSMTAGDTHPSSGLDLAFGSKLRRDLQEALGCLLMD